MVKEHMLEVTVMQEYIMKTSMDRITGKTSMQYTTWEVIKDSFRG